MSSFGHYGRGPWMVVYSDQVNRFGTEDEARAWAAKHGGRVEWDGRQDSGNLFEAGALRDRADGRNR